MFDTCEGHVEFFGAIASICGDNPGSAAVAGFKKSSSAFHLATKKLMTVMQFITSTICVIVL